MEHRFHHLLQPGRDHGLRDPVRDGRYPEQPGPATMRFRYLHRPHRGREVTTRAHPVPDLVQVVLQIGLELPERHLIHSRRALIGLHLPVCLPHLQLRNGKRLARRLQLAHATPPGFPVDQANTATDDPAPSLRPHYRGFLTTTSRSASTPRDGTQSLTVSAAREPPCRHRSAAAVSGRAFSRSAQEQQARLTSPSRRTPPGQSAGRPPGSSRGRVITPVLMSSRALSTRQQRSSSWSPPDASNGRLFLIAHHDGLQPTQHEVV